MRPFLFYLLLSLAFFSSHAQTMFAPPGSEWYHHMSDGVFHSYYVGDTTISGIACRKVIRNASVKEPLAGMGLHVEDLPTIYVYNNSDTVFVYNTIFSRFTPLYVFNVNDGDIVHLPMLPDDIGMNVFSYADSQFSFRVDSVRMKLYDTTMLKTVYTHVLGNPDSVYTYNYAPFADTFGAYAEKLGALYIGIMPFGYPAAIPLTESSQLADTLRCYTDPMLSVHLVSGNCGLPTEQVAEASINGAIRIFPNPATDMITVAGLVQKAMVEVFSADGRVVYRAAAASNNVYIPVSSLQGGAYVLRIMQNGIPSEYRNVCVAH